MDNTKARRIVKICVIVLLVFLAVMFFLRNRASHKSIAGIRPPKQTETTGGTKLSVDGETVNVSYKYEYEIEGLVVHTKRHHGFGMEDDISPIDVALAWGDVAEYNDRINFHWSQRGRFYYWRVSSYDELEPIGSEVDVIRQSSNNHLIPSSSEMRSKIKSIMPGDHIKIKGYLVDLNCTKSNGSTFYWNSSTIRSDDGDGACELIYVTDLTWLD